MRRLMPLLVVVAGVLGLAGCASVAPRSCPAGGPGVVHHVVLCWLKEPGNADMRQTLVDVSKSFRDLPGVLQVSAGVALPSERPVVDGSYDVAVEVVLRDRAALAAYLRHPRHLQAGRDVLAPLAAKIVIYDFVE